MKVMSDFLTREYEVKRQIVYVHRAFTLLELLIVVVILGILAAIIIPHFKTMSGDASAAALKTDLQRLRDAIDRYEADHGRFPTIEAFAAQITQFSNFEGATSVSKDATHALGPYLMNLPKLPVGANVGKTSVTADAGADGFGWLYNPATGDIHAHADVGEVDADGRAYSSY